MSTSNFYPDFFLQNSETLQNTLEVFIYYVNPVKDHDKSFERAAKYAASQSASAGRNTELIPVTTKGDFIRAWQNILEEATFNEVLVSAVHIFTHASFQWDQKDGLEFAESVGGKVLTKKEILALPILPWHQYSFMYLHGCHSGDIGWRGWCPAKTFFLTQNIAEAWGEEGSAYFSRNEKKYEEILLTDKEVYLFSYSRRKNNPLGDGHRIMPIVFK